MNVSPIPSSRQVTQADAQVWLRYWRDERNSAALYGALAAAEKSARRARTYARLAELEARHANLWAERLHEAGIVLPPFQASWQTRLLTWLARQLGTAVVLPRIAALEQAEAEGYLGYVEGRLFEEEQENAMLLAQLSQREVSEFFKKVILKLRKTVLFIIGGALFTISLLLARNVQLEGLFFGLLTGVFVGPVMHYLLGKVLIALPFGRIWCGWACWTAALVDQLPYRKSAGWLPKHYRRGRYLHLFGSLGLVLVLFFGFGYREGALGQSAASWFVLGNLLYWLTAVVLAIVLKDNRAFCKYACPVSVLLKVTSRPALLKVSGDAQACLDCASQACTTLCPMDIEIPKYIKAGKRVLATECILCQHCIAVCPPNTLGLSFGFDLGGEDLLEERPQLGKGSRQEAGTRGPP
jgi:ferredoxin-type protein NapH